MNQEHSQPSNRAGIVDDMRTAFCVFTLFIGVMGRAWAVFARRNTGERWIGYLGALVPFAAVLYASFFPRMAEQRALVGFSMAFIVACGCQHFTHFTRRMRGEYVHSRYCGDSVLASKFPRWSPSKVRTIVEPPFLIGLSIAIGLVTGCRGIQSFLIASAIGLWIEERLMTLRDRMLVDQMRDQRIEQQIFAEEIRNF